MQWCFWRRKQREADLDDEIAFDLAAETEERIRSGMSHENAASASRRDFGNVLRLKEDVREVWNWLWLQRLGQDIRYGWRTLRNSPLFAAMAVLSLALGIGANTAIYSLIDAMMLRALPVKNPGELVILNWSAKQFPEVAHSTNGSTHRDPGGGFTSPDFPWQAYELVRDHNSVFSTVFAYKNAGPALNLIVRGQAEMGSVEYVSGKFFNSLGIVPAIGRLIADGDDRAGVSQVAVLSYKYWRERFAGDPAAVGQTIRIKDIPFTIAGVAPPEFFGVTPGFAPALYIPMANRPSLNRNYGNERDTITMAEAQAEVAGHFAGRNPIGQHFKFGRSSIGELTIVGVAKNARYSSLKDAIPPVVYLSLLQDVIIRPPTPMFFELRTAGNPLALAETVRKVVHDAAPLVPVTNMMTQTQRIDSTITQERTFADLCSAFAILVLIIACVGLYGVMAYAVSRRTNEIGIRIALGAERRRIVWMVMREVLAFAVVGLIIGLACAWTAMSTIKSFVFGMKPADPLTIVIALVILLAALIVAGLAPATRACRIDPLSALRHE